MIFETENGSKNDLKLLIYGFWFGIMALEPFLGQHKHRFCVLKMVGLGNFAQRVLTSKRLKNRQNGVFRRCEN
jgi:hypothetical protein